MKKLIVLLVLISMLMYSSTTNEVTLKIWAVDNGKLLKDYKIYDSPLLIKYPLFLKNGDIFFYNGASFLLNIEKGTIKEQGESMHKKQTGVNTYKGENFLFIGYDGLFEYSPQKDSLKMISNKKYDFHIAEYNKYNNTLVLTDRYSSRLLVFDLNTKKIRKTDLTSMQHTIDLCFSPDGKHIVLGINNNSIVFVDTKNYKVEKTLWDMGTTYTMKYSPDGKILACGSANGYIYIIDVNKKNIIKKFKAHNSVIYSVDFSADGTRLLTSSGESTELQTIDNTVKVWDMKTYKEILRINLERVTDKNDMISNGASFTPDGKFILTYPVREKPIEDFGL